MSYRQAGKEALSTVLTIPQNINTFDKYIYEYCSQTVDEDNIEQLYINCVYQIIGDVIEGKSMKDILDIVKNDQFNYDHPDYFLLKEKRNEQDSYLINPFVVFEVEGVNECPKCSCTKTCSYNKMDRGRDEPMSTYAICVKCKHSWRDNK